MKPVLVFRIALTSWSGLTAAEKPNFIIININDLGYADIGESKNVACSNGGERKRPRLPFLVPRQKWAGSAIRLRFRTKPGASCIRTVPGEGAEDHTRRRVCSPLTYLRSSGGIHKS